MNFQRLHNYLNCHILWLLSGYEKHTPEIRLLCSKDTSFWPKAQAMRQLPQNLENKAPKARASTYKAPLFDDQPRFTKAAKPSKSNEWPVSSNPTGSD